MKKFREAFFLATLIAVASESGAAIITQNSNKLPGILGIGTTCHLTLQLQNRGTVAPTIYIISIGGVPQGATVNQNVPIPVSADSHGTTLLVQPISNLGAATLPLNFTYAYTTGSNQITYPFTVNVIQQGGVCSVASVTPQQTHLHANRFGFGTINANRIETIVVTANTLTFS